MLRKKILLIDDSSFFAKYIEGIISAADYEFIHASSGEEGLTMVKTEKPDLVLLDVIMPDMDGLEVCRILRESESNNFMPIIILTSSDDEEDKLSSLEYGADDYITKPFNQRELLSRVKNTLKRIERSRSANPLTGLSGNIEIQAELIKKIECKEPFSVIYADIDNFKAYNDVYGFSKGDMAIKITADILTDQVRETGNQDDFIGHIGGDDFVIITSSSDTDSICESIISEFDRRIKEIYTAEDLRNGRILSRDRKGEYVEYPIMTISLAIIDNQECCIDNYYQISRMAAEIKSKAKSITGSSFLKASFKE
ncbi:MAG: response regulator [Clostridiales bacterium]|jgi:diguanylate cyclase (GGDEF)-like protein|nr:response regulator [Clostridiales bacterium]